MVNGASHTLTLKFLIKKTKNNNNNNKTEDFTAKKVVICRPLCHNFTT